MRFIKKYLKFIIGIAVLILVLIVFVHALMTKNNLEVGTLKDWQKVTTERKMSSVRMIVADDDNLELLVACVDKIATLPDSGEMSVRDAVTLCHTGFKLKESI